MLKNVPLVRDSTVLELGCGDGFQLSLLRQRFARVFAIDPANVPEEDGGCAYAVAEALPFRDKTFDLIVSNCVVEHLNDRRLALD
jgi:ubiquinone/menaquinone biosynthesis C-methylase UbiE